MSVPQSLRFASLRPFLGSFVLLGGFAIGVSCDAREADFEDATARMQMTYNWQRHPAFDAAYSGPNSITGGADKMYTFTATAFLGVRPWRGGEIYLNPEVSQGVPFTTRLVGLGGFTNGEVQRGVSADFKAYRARLFVRHSWNLGGEVEAEGSAPNQLAARYSAERVVLTAGNFSVLDVFDAVDYSRDARTQFMNWASLTYGAWDYPADARGYTWGAALEYLRPGWQVRAGRFLVPVESNGLRLDRHAGSRYGDVAEFELPYRLAGRPAVARALVFRNRVAAGSYSDALALAGASGGIPDVAPVRRTQSKQGAGLGTQVELTRTVGAFARAGWSDGRTETFMFTEIDRSLSAGVQVRGEGWGRAKDSVGLAAYLNGLSRPHRDYLAAGGQGFFLGDGRLNYGQERIVEAYYSLNVLPGAWLSVDVQRIGNPGYNRDRAPASFLGLRAHAEL